MTVSSLRRRFPLVGLVVLAVAGLVSLTILVPASAPVLVADIAAPIHISGTGSDGVLLRPTSNTSQPAIGWIPEGASPTYHCFEYGQVISGVPIWFSVTYNGKTGFYASAFDDAHYQSDAELTQKYGVPKCGTTGNSAPQPASPTQPKPAPVAGYYSPFNAGGRGNDGKDEDLLDQEGVYTANVDNWYACADASDKPYFALDGQLNPGQYFDRIGGWSLGRLGPAYLIRGMQEYDPNLLRTLNYIILIDPGPYSDLSVCDARASAGEAYAKWLQYNTRAHLVILSGNMTQTDNSQGIQQVYFNPIRNAAGATDIRSRVLVCNYDADHYKIYDAGQYWIKHQIGGSCPVLNYNGTRWSGIGWHP